MQRKCAGEQTDILCKHSRPRLHIPEHTTLSEQHNRGLLYLTPLTTKKAVLLELPPHHLIHNPSVALDDFDDFGGDVFVDVVGDGEAVVAGGVH